MIYDVETGIEPVLIKGTMYYYIPQNGILNLRGKISEYEPQRDAFYYKNSSEEIKMYIPKISDGANEILIRNAGTRNIYVEGKEHIAFHFIVGTKTDLKE